MLCKVVYGVKCIYVLKMHNPILLSLKHVFSKKLKKKHSSWLDRGWLSMQLFGIMEGSSLTLFGFLFIFAVVRFIGTFLLYLAFENL